MSVALAALAAWLPDPNKWFDPCADAEALASSLFDPPGKRGGNSGGLKPGSLFLSNEAIVTPCGASTVGAYVIIARFKLPKTLLKKLCVLDFKVGVLGGMLMSWMLGHRPTLPASVLCSLNTMGSKRNC